MSVNKSLRKIAAKLPPMPLPGTEGTNVRRSGKGEHIMLSKRGHQVAQKLEAQKDYSRDIGFVPVDHFEALKHAWETAGNEGVESYVKYVAEHTPKKRAAAMVKNMTFRARLLYRLRRLLVKIRSLWKRNKK